MPDVPPDIAPDAPDDRAPDVAPDAPGDVATEVRQDAGDGPPGDAPSEAPTPVCGNRKLEAGETCDYGNDGEFCKQCQVTCRGTCPWSRAPDTCAALSGDDQISCLALLNCMAFGLSQCAFVVFDGIAGPSRCYCTDATCSKGADGPCAKEFEAVAKTTDPAEVLRQLADPSTTVAGVGEMAKRYGMASFCILGCMNQP